MKAVRIQALTLLFRIIAVSLIVAAFTLDAYCGQFDDPTTAMTHIAIAEVLDGKVVEWMEKVTDEEYFAESQA